MTLNGNFDSRVVIDTTHLDWAESPSSTVWRKRLDLVGPAEAGRVTSVVRYDAGSTFPVHDHPDGEEILVLDGVFSDERGDFPAGTYMLNPEGFRHAPRSKDGCLLFVKLRQYGGPRETVLVDTATEEWSETKTSGVTCIPLYASPSHPERMHLLSFAPNASMDEVLLEDGGEILVLKGSLADEHGSYRKHTWLRMPPGHRHTPRSAEGCVLYVKVGGLPRA